jgi:hypothetical protein
MAAINLCLKNAGKLQFYRYFSLFSAVGYLTYSTNLRLLERNDSLDLSQEQSGRAVNKDLNLTIKDFFLLGS